MSLVVATGCIRIPACAQDTWRMQGMVSGDKHSQVAALKRVVSGFMAHRGPQEMQKHQCCNAHHGQTGASAV